MIIGFTGAESTGKSEAGRFLVDTFEFTKVDFAGLSVLEWEDYLYRNSIQNDYIVATDIRFSNEAEKIQELGGLVVRMVRPGFDKLLEKPIPDLLIDAEISNTGDIDDLHVDVHELYSNYVRSLDVP